jgi:gliding motility-associated-like protein
MDADTILVDISGVSPTVALGADTTLCEGLTLTLISTAVTGTSIEWQDGSSSSTYVVSTPGLYSLSESNRCGDATDTVTIGYLDAPDPFILGSDTILCPGEAITLTVPTTAFNIRWQDGSNQPTMIADKAQTYSLQLSNDCGSVSDEFVVDYDIRVPQLNLAPSVKWCDGDNITLDATQPFSADYLWNTGATAPTLHITTPGVYSIDVSTLCSTVSQVIEVIPSDDCSLFEVHTEIHIPNIFSPTGDGINDLFAMSFGPDIELTSMHGTIFDRWGNMVFNSEALPFTWDGYFKNERVMPGVYVYRIECKYLADGVPREEVFVGDVTVIR